VRVDPAAHARGSFGGCSSDCTARHEDVLCDACAIPWELHLRSHSGHGCNPSQQRGSFDGCDGSCTLPHPGTLCDACNRPWEIHACGHYCTLGDEPGVFVVCLRSC